VFLFCRGGDSADFMFFDRAQFNGHRRNRIKGNVTPSLWSYCNVQIWSCNKLLQYLNKPEESVVKSPLMNKIEICFRVKMIYLYTWIGVWNV